MTNFDTIALLGQRFRTYRKALHISQRQLHEKTGVSLFTISSFENGKGQGLSLSHLLSLLHGEVHPSQNLSQSEGLGQILSCQ